MKNQTNFCKTLETGVREPCLVILRGRGYSYILELCEGGNIADCVTFSKIFVFSQFTVIVFQLF